MEVAESMDSLINRIGFFAAIDFHCRDIEYAARQIYLNAGDFVFKNYAKSTRFRHQEIILNFSFSNHLTRMMKQNSWWKTACNSDLDRRDAILGRVRDIGQERDGATIERNIAARDGEDRDQGRHEKILGRGHDSAIERGRDQDRDRER